MVIDRTKLAFWVLGIAGLGAVYLAMHEEPAPRPEPPPIHVDIPAPAPVAVPVPAPVPGVVDPIKPKVHVAPAAKPKPVEKAPAPVAKANPKSKNIVYKRRPARSSCAKVPKIAYQYDAGLVISTAVARGVTGADLEMLKRCISAEH